ncbi:hypothetical protein JOC59_001602 [Weissella beninensis]|nr:hypothetical protein [Periweissella beninensis]
MRQFLKIVELLVIVDVLISWDLTEQQWQFIYLLLN